MVKFTQALLCLLTSSAATALLEKRDPPQTPSARTAPQTLSTRTVPDMPVLPQSGCSEAAMIGIGDTVMGSIDSADGVWYQVQGTGGYLAASTCTDDELLNMGGFDTVLTVYSGECDFLFEEAYDDDGGDCGNLKSKARFETMAGETYYVHLTPYGGYYYEEDNHEYGLTIFETEAPCQTEGECCISASTLELDIPTLIPSDGMGFWSTFQGTFDGYLSVTLCSSDGSPVDAYADVYEGDCDLFNYVTSVSSYGTDCVVGYFESFAGETYNLYTHAYTYDYYGYYGDVDVTIVVSEATELPNNECERATALEMGVATFDEISTPYETKWYSLVGTGEELVITTCTGESPTSGGVSLDNNSFDSVITVYARDDCNDLRMIATDDEGGKCGNGKSRVVLDSVDGLVYKVSVSEYYNSMMTSDGQFGLLVSEKVVSEN